MLKKDISLLNPSILRENDIRGIVGKTLFPQDAFWIGRAFGQIAKEKTKEDHPLLVVGWDGRLTSPTLKENLLKGLLESSVHVLSVGLGPTPLVSYGIHALKAHGGIMITGSHNPAEYNGFKMTLLGSPFSGEDIVCLSKMIPHLPNSSLVGTLRPIDLYMSYIDRLQQGLHLKPFKCVWDPGNGACGEILQKLLPLLPGEHILLNSQIDGNFPNHHPDPTVPENLVQLQEKVRETNADFGCAFDGDGDRLGVVDGKGRILWGDQLMILFAQDVLKNIPGSPILADVKASDILFEHISEKGGVPVMCRTGHSLIKAKMKELKSPLAGEMSGHIFFADKYYGYDDALYAALRLMEILSQNDISLTTFHDQLPKIYSTPEIRIDVENSTIPKKEIIEEIKRKLHSQNIPYDNLDGIRLKKEKIGWWGLRASNTQEVLTFRCESRSAAGLDSLCQEVNSYLLPFNLKVF